MAKSRPDRKKAGLTRVRIAEAGLILLDRDGPEGLSMRKLAQELGVEAMSLYNHVRDKRQLLEDIVNLAVAQAPLPPATRPWRERLEVLVLGLYRALIAHPHTVMILSREDAAIREPRALALIDAAAKALADAGLTPAAQVSAFRGLIALCFGFALAHTRGTTSTRAEAEAIWDRWDPSDFEASGFESLAKLAPQFLKTRANDDLRFMLAAYLDALEARVR